MGERSHWKMVMKIALIGAGNLATNIGPALKAAGHDVVQVYSRTMESAVLLADKLECACTNNIEAVTHDADIYIVAVKDNALESLAQMLCKGREEHLFVHTAGSMPLEVFKGVAKHYGVLYPMQTFSKNKSLDFSKIPCFVEAESEESLALIKTLAASITNSVYELTSENRKYLHLAAVFACNFANHCYSVAADLLEKHGIPFQVMLPLIDETAEKVHHLAPREAQTGPAVRYDENVMQKHLALLHETPNYEEIYKLMSKSIHEQSK